MSENNIKETLAKFSKAISTLIEERDSYRKKLNEILFELNEKIDSTNKNISNLQQNIQKLIEDKKQTIIHFEKTESLKQDFSSLKDQIDKISQTFATKKDTDKIENNINQNIDEKIEKSENKIKQQILSYVREEFVSKYQNSEKTIKHNFPILNQETDSDIHFAKISTKEYEDRPNITRINTDEIKRKIMEAISLDKNEIKTENLYDFKAKIKEILLKIKLNEYNLPCFFDGTEIFGVYDEKKPRDLHIFSRCNLVNEEGLAKATSDVILIDGKEKKLEICKHCIKSLYGENKKINLSEFIQDFLSGKITQTK